MSNREKETRRRAPRSRTLSGIVGGILLVVGLVWMVWLIVAPRSNGSSIAAWPFGGQTPTSVPVVQIPPLLAEGITLHTADHAPALSQPQALAIASQLEPDAAVQAKTVSARYVLFSYPNVSTPAVHGSFNNQPVWMIWYQKIPLEPSDASVDPQPYPHSVHDLYVFLDASSGKELLAIWI